MKKILGVLLMFSLVLGVMGVVADENQPVEGVVDDFVNISVLPTTLDFGAIPYGVAITHPGEIVTINTVGSDTASNNTKVEVSSVEGNDELFYEALLEYNKTGWTNVLSLSVDIPEGEFVEYSTRLQGDSASFNAGPKNAVIVYTATGEPPG